MNINQFYAIREVCPICNTPLSKVVDIYLYDGKLVHSTTNYSYDGSMFFHNRSHNFLGSPQSHFQHITNLANIFSQVKKTKLLKPIITLIRSCSNNHYRYQSTAIINPKQNPEFEYEEIRIYDIVTVFSNYATSVYIKDDFISLPLIPINKWDFSSKQALTNQIERYLLLK
jgi:hypothetical protein